MIPALKNIKYKYRLLNVHKVHGGVFDDSFSRCQVLEETEPVLHINEVCQVEIFVNIWRIELFEGDNFSLSSHFGAVGNVFLCFDCAATQSTNDDLMRRMVIIATVDYSSSNSEEKTC